MSFTTAATATGKIFATALSSALNEPGSADGFVANNINLLRVVKKIQHQAIQLSLKGGLTISEVATELNIEEDKVIDLSIQPIDLPMCVGCIVQANGGYGLRSGGSAYDCAVVVSVNPYIMMSEAADMKWTAQKKENYTVIGTASEEVLAKCMSRLNG
jgi:hypothetical protein